MNDPSSKLELHREDGPSSPPGGGCFQFSIRKLFALMWAVAVVLTAGRLQDTLDIRHALLILGMAIPPAVMGFQWINEGTLFSASAPEYSSPVAEIRYGLCLAPFLFMAHAALVAENRTALTPQVILWGWYALAILWLLDARTWWQLLLAWILCVGVCLPLLVHDREGDDIARGLLLPLIYLLGQYLPRSAVRDSEPTWRPLLAGFVVGMLPLLSLLVLGWSPAGLGAWLFFLALPGTTLAFAHAICRSWIVLLPAAVMAASLATGTTWEPERFGERYPLYGVNERYGHWQTLFLSQRVNHPGPNGAILERYLWPGGSWLPSDMYIPARDIDMAEWIDAVPEEDRPRVLESLIDRHNRLAHEQLFLLQCLQHAGPSDREQWWKENRELFYSERSELQAAGCSLAWEPYFAQLRWPAGKEAVLDRCWLARCQAYDRLMRDARDAPIPAKPTRPRPNLDWLLEDATDAGWIRERSH